MKKLFEEKELVIFIMMVIICLSWVYKLNDLEWVLQTILQKIITIMLFLSLIISGINYVGKKDDDEEK